MHPAAVPLAKETFWRHSLRQAVVLPGQPAVRAELVVTGAEGLSPRKAPEAKTAATQPTRPNVAESRWRLRFYLEIMKCNMPEMLCIFFHLQY